MVGHESVDPKPQAKADLVTGVMCVCAVCVCACITIASGKWRESPGGCWQWRASLFFLFAERCENVRARIVCVYTERETPPRLRRKGIRS